MNFDENDKNKIKITFIFTSDVKTCDLKKIMK
jgi:hypothetical protein